MIKNIYTTTRHNLAVALLSATITTLVAGCAPQNLKDSQSATLNNATSKLGSVGEHDVSNVRHMPVQYIGTPKTSREYVEPLPSEFNGSVTLTRGTSLTFAGLASEIYKAQADSGLRAIPVVVMPQLNMDQNGRPVVPDTVSTPAMPSANVPGELQGINLPNLSSMPAISRAEITDFDSTRIQPLKYVNVPLKKLLDDVTASNNLAWRYANGKIVIYRHVTKTVRLNGIPGSSSMVTSITRSGGGAISGASGSSSMGGAAGGYGGGAGSSGGSSNGNSQGSLAQTTKLDADKLDIWESLKKTLPTMLSEKGVVVINPAMGTLTMRDEPVVVEEISRYLSELNASMSKQVAIDVAIYLVSLNDTSQYGINWEVAFEQASKNFSLSGASMAMPQVAAGAAALSFLIPETAQDPTVRQFSGSEFLVTALETAGTITNKYTVPVRTQNLQPVQIANRVQEAYLAQSGTTQTANVGSATTNIPGMLTTGLELALLPHIQDTNDVVIQYGVTLSAKSGIRTISSGGTTIEAPEVGVSDFVGRVTMRSGQTLVMSGLEQLTMKLDETGNLAAGGGWTKNGQHVVLVLAITPRLETAANSIKNIWPFKFVKPVEVA